MASATELALSRRDGPAFAWIELDRLPHRPRESLVDGLAHVVVVLTVEQLDVQRDPRALCDRVEPVLDQLGIPFAELFLREARLPYEERPPRNVERDTRQSLVHRRIGVAVAADPGLVAERL